MQHAIAECERLSGAGKLRHIRPCLPRRGKQLKAGAGDDAQRSPTSDEKLHHVVAGDIFYHSPAAFGLASVSGHESHTDAIIAQAAVAVAMRAIQTRCQHSTDGGTLWQRWVACKEEFVSGQLSG